MWTWPAAARENSTRRLGAYPPWPMETVCTMYIPFDWVQALSEPVKARDRVPA